MADKPSGHLSVRWSASLVGELDRHAALTGESRNALTERLVGQALRSEQHPLISFRRGTGGSEAGLVGTRLHVRDVIATLRASDNSLASTAEYLGVAPRLVQAAVEYYADFADEIDAELESAAALAERERERWERAQRVLAG